MLTGELKKCARTRLFQPKHLSEEIEEIFSCGHWLFAAHLPAMLTKDQCHMDSYSADRVPLSS